MKRHASFLAISFIFMGIVPAMARGDKIIPHIADGIHTDGTVFRTKIDIINLGPFDSIPGTSLKIQFFRQNGTPWSIATNRGTASEFQLSLGPAETIRIQTNGATPPLVAGYAIVRNTATDDRLPNFAEDFEVSISVYYEVLKGAEVVDTVSVPVGQRTVHWQFPVEIDAARGLLSGIAIMNLSNTTSRITLNLYRANGPVYGTPDATTTISLGPNQQTARFLNEGDLFPSVSTFKGMAEGFSEFPVTTLALLQVPTTAGVQYATLSPAYIDSMRRNTNMYLPQGTPLDLDVPSSDYFADIADTNGQDETPWDIIYAPPTGSTRRIEPVSGAQIAAIGILNDAEFDGVTLSTLQNLAYSTNSIDMSDTSDNLVPGFTFAVKTGLGQYAKVHLVDGVTDQSGTTLDFVLEIYVFK